MQDPAQDGAVEMRLAPETPPVVRRNSCRTPVAPRTDHGVLAGASGEESLHPLRYTPRKLFLTKGVGRHKERLASFEEALRHAGIASLNLVSVSSIFPPHCKVISRAEGLRMLTPGQIAFCVMARSDSNEYRQLMAASVGLAIPKESSNYGYLSEHHSHGEIADKAGEYTEDLAACMLATVLGVDYDEDATWDERKEIWRISGKIYKTRNVTQAALGARGGVWTTCVAAAVFCD